MLSLEPFLKDFLLLGIKVEDTMAPLAQMHFFAFMSSVSSVVRIHFITQKYPLEIEKLLSLPLNLS